MRKLKWIAHIGIPYAMDAEICSFQPVSHYIMEVVEVGA